MKSFSALSPEMLLKLFNLLEFAFFVRMIVCIRKRQLWQPWCKIFFKIWNFSALNPRKTQTFPIFCKNHLLLKTFLGTRRMQLSQRWRKVVSEDQISFKSMPRNDFKKNVSLRATSISTERFSEDEEISFDKWGRNFSKLQKMTLEIQQWKKKQCLFREVCFSLIWSSVHVEFSSGNYAENFVARVRFLCLQSKSDQSIEVFFQISLFAQNIRLYTKSAVSKTLPKFLS